MNAISISKGKKLLFPSKPGSTGDIWWNVDPAFVQCIKDYNRRMISTIIISGWSITCPLLKPLNCEDGTLSEAAEVFWLVLIVLCKKKAIEKLKKKTGCWSRKKMASTTRIAFFRSGVAMQQWEPASLLQWFCENAGACRQSTAAVAEW